MWKRIVDEIARFRSGIREVAVTPRVSGEAVRAELEARYAFEKPVPLPDVVEDVIRLFRSANVQVTHPLYFGLFNPSVREAGIAADTLAALFNPQLAAASHSPAEYEIERVTARFFARQIGFDADASFAGFTSGGMESNLTAALCAIADRVPESSARGLSGGLAIYTSEEGHHSFVKIARMTGLGTDALRTVPVDDALRMIPSELQRRVAEDGAHGIRPLLVVATAGTTSAGAVDPLREIAAVTRASGAWLHVDAAWGAAALLSPRLRPLLDGIQLADSVTWDAHKWLSVPMSAGMFFCRHPEAVRRAFEVSTSYMPPPSGLDPYFSSVQWSRRAIGLKVFVSLAELGAGGYAELVERQAEMGDALRRRLTDRGFRVVNRTELPVVCFTHPDIEEGRVSTQELLERLYARGRVWISAVTLKGAPALRACITSYRSTVEDVQTLVDEVERVRVAARGDSPG